MAFPRNALRPFMGYVKRSLPQYVEEGRNIHLVIGNQSADLDSFTSSVLYAYIKSIAPPKDAFSQLYIPLLNLHKDGIRLRPEFSVVCRHAGLEKADLLTLEDIPESAFESDSVHWILMDHNKPTGQFENLPANKVEGVIDHHDDEHFVNSPSKAELRIIEKAGSCTSLVVRYCRSTWDSISDSAQASGAAHGQGDHDTSDAAFAVEWDAQVAKMALASILIDTANLTASDKVEPVDRETVDYLEAKINMSPKSVKYWNRDNFFKEVSDAKSDIGQLTLAEVLSKDYKQWVTPNGLNLGISSVVKDLDFLSKKAEDESKSKSTALEQSLVDFMRQNKLEVHGIMTAFKTGDKFRRQLLLQASLEKEGVQQKIEGFVHRAAEELELEELDGNIQSSTGSVWRHAWWQRNVSNSRKQVAPMLRTALE